MNIDFIRHHGSFRISYRHDSGYRKVSVMEVGECVLKGIMQIVCQRRRLFGRSEDACIHAILLTMTIIRD